MAKKIKRQRSASRLLKSKVFIILALILTIILGSFFWYRQNYAWNEYNNACLRFSYRVRARLHVKTNCSSYIDGRVGSGNGPYAVEISQNSYIHVLGDLSGPTLNFYVPATPPNVIPLSTSVPDAFKKFTNANPGAKRTTIGGHLALESINSSPDQPPKGWHSVDSAYCPCTSENILIDQGPGTNRIVAVLALWRNHDQQAVNDINFTLNSIVFHL